MRWSCSLRLTPQDAGNQESGALTRSSPIAPMQGSANTQRMRIGLPIYRIIQTRPSPRRRVIVQAILLTVYDADNVETAGAPEQRGDHIARKTVRVSDMSGEEILEGKGAVVRITFADARKGARELDVTDAEAERLGGRHVARRGRKPRAAQSAG